jgi:serine/threonine protein kinase
MTPTECPATESLEQFLADCLSGAEAESLRVHVSACGRCQKLLDRLSDDNDLRQWLPESPVTEQGEESGLVRLRNYLAGSSALTINWSRRENSVPVPVTFLGPPRQSGELGMLGPYPILEELGRGGMGIVFRALDEALGRTVAVKVLRPDHDSSLARARFVHEARAAARLRHEHVVSIYAVADPPGGLPYFTMEYIPGTTLAGRLNSAPRLESRQAAEIASQVAAGLVAAHAAGLVHRDLKPANILLDPVSGRAKLADFGLARLEASPSGLTEEGALAGTPSYMSPEQVRGEQAIDARSDIYSLGVTLYEALTGEAPFRGTTHAVLRQVLFDEPRPPRRLNETIPCDLETVCLKAMAKEPRSRYATADEVRADLNRFLDGAPVKARPVGPVGRLARWCRRSPKVAVLSAALALVATAGIVAVLWQWRRAEANATEASANAANAKTQSQRAETNLQAARENLGDARRAVDTFFTLAEESNIFGQPEGSPLRKQLLAEALDYYQGFVRRAHDDPTVREKLADAHYRLGFLTLLAGDRSKALESLQKAVPGLRELLNQRPNDTSVRRRLSLCLFHMGEADLKLGRLQDAREAYEGARDNFEKLIRAGVPDPDLAANFAATIGNLADIYGRMGDGAAAQDAYLYAKKIQERMVRAFPDNQGYRVQLARSLSNFGSREKDAEASLKYHEQARTIREQLHKTQPNSTVYRSELALSYKHMAGIWQQRRNYSAALALLDRAIELLVPAVKAEPNVMELRRHLAEAWEARGHVLIDANRPSEAAKAFTEDSKLLKQLIALSPKERGLRHNLAVAYERLGGLFRDLGRTAESRVAYQQMLQTLDGLLQESPDDAGYRKSVTVARQHLERLGAERNKDSSK